MREAIYRGVGLNAIVMFALFAGLAVVAPDLLPVLFGQNWVAAAPLCSLLSIYALVSALQLFGYPAVIASGSMVQYVALTASYSTGVVIACLVGMKFGTTYLILGLTANSLIQAVPCVAHLRRRIGLNWTSYCSPCLIPAGAAVFMVGAIQIVSLLLTAHAPQLWRLVCHVVVGAAAYLGFLRAFANGGLTELVQIVVAALRRSDPLNESTRS
jgi:O-antigen/teichoic acid export membrane protein